VWAPDIGWVDFDPTNGLMPRDEHITIAYGRDYDDVSPISGILLGGSEHSVRVGVDVLPVG
jgi:transglutaminase-like putative cysteine protease